MNRFIELLKKPPSIPCFFWKGRGNPKAYFGYGEAKSSSFTFKAQAFHPKGCRGIWSDFPHEWNFLPDQLLSANWSPLLSNPPVLHHCIKRQDSPSFELWSKVVEDACQKIERDIFTKVVLARQTTLIFDEPVNPLEIFKGLMIFTDQTSLFMIRLNPSTVFIGASPEKLFNRIDRKIWTEALAGTIDSTEKWSPKEFAEVDAVRIYLQQQLSPYCQDLHWGTPEERSFGNLRHLYQKLEGVIKANISDRLLVEQLHPTPALGGFPRQLALEYLRSVEPFDRGWYGAPIGLVSEMETDLAVSIRPVLVRGNEVHLFAGAGIVKGSTALKEWEELEHKIAHVLRWIQK